MALEFNIEISDADLPFFMQAMQRAEQRASGRSAQQILDAAHKTLSEASGQSMPEFVRSRVGSVENLIAMVGDEGWALGAEDRSRIISALTYFADPEDLIPDNVPVLGFLDDAIMIELCQRELQHEIDAYEEFVAHRAAEAKHRGVDVNTVKMQRVDWLEDRRAELQARMTSRRTESYVPTSFSQALFRVT